MSITALRDLRVVALLATLCCLLWGSAFPAIKAGYAWLSIAPGDTASQLLFAGWRFVLAGLILLCWARAAGRSLGLSRAQARNVTLLGLGQTALQYVFFYIGVAHTTGAKASIMNATTVFFTVLLAHFVYANDRLSRRKAVGCLLGFAGVVVVNLAGSGLDLDLTLAGEGAIVASSLIIAVTMIFGKRISQTLDPVVMTGWQLAIGGAALVAAGEAGGGQLRGFGLSAGLLLGYMAVLSAVAFALWSTLLRNNPVSFVTSFNFTIPIFGVTLSALLLGESVLELRYAAGLVLVSAGVWLVTRAARLPASTP